jgi:hypothetical protein
LGAAGIRHTPPPKITQQLPHGLRASLGAAPEGGPTQWALMPSPGAMALPGMASGSPSVALNKVLPAPSSELAPIAPPGDGGVSPRNHRPGGEMPRTPRGSRKQRLPPARRSKGWETSRSLDQAPVKKGCLTVFVRTTMETGALRDTGTDGKVVVQLHGEHGKAGQELELARHSAFDFASGGTCKFMSKIMAAELGDIKVGGHIGAAASCQLPAATGRRLTPQPLPRSSVLRRENHA